MDTCRDFAPYQCWRTHSPDYVPSPGQPGITNPQVVKDKCWLKWKNAWRLPQTASWRRLAELSKSDWMQSDRHYWELLRWNKGLRFIWANTLKQEINGWYGSEVCVLPPVQSHPAASACSASDIKHSWIIVYLSPQSTILVVYVIIIVMYWHYRILIITSHNKVLAWNLKTNL